MWCENRFLIEIIDPIPRNQRMVEKNTSHSTTASRRKGGGLSKDDSVVELTLPTLRNVANNKKAPYARAASRLNRLAILGILTSFLRWTRMAIPNNNTVASPQRKNHIATKACGCRWFIGKTPTSEQNIAETIPVAIPAFAQVFGMYKPNPRQKRINKIPVMIIAALNSHAFCETPIQPSSEMNRLSSE